MTKYSGDLNSEHLNSGLLEVRYSDHVIQMPGSYHLPGKKIGDKSWCPYETSKIVIVTNRRIHPKYVCVVSVKISVYLESILLGQLL